MIPVIYSKATGLIRRWTLPANAAEAALLQQKPPQLLAGEALWWCDPSQYDHYRVMQATLNKITGLSPRIGVDDRCVVVDKQTGAIESVMHADPAIDVIPGKSLVQHDLADTRWTFDSVQKTFTAPALTPQEQANVNAKTAQAQPS